MLYVVKTQFATEIDDVFSGIKGTWGMPFWAATTSFLGIYSTMIINASDYSRNVKEKIGPVFTGSIYTSCDSACDIIHGADRTSGYGSDRKTAIR